jgi:hypothetical protein
MTADGGRWICVRGLRADTMTAVFDIAFDCFSLSLVCLFKHAPFIALKNYLITFFSSTEIKHTHTPVPTPTHSTAHLQTTVIFNFKEQQRLE